MKIVISKKGNIDPGALAAGEVEKAVNNIVFEDVDEAIEYAVGRYGAGEFQLYELCSTCSEDSFKPEPTTKYKGRYKTTKRVKVLKEINF